MKKISSTEEIEIDYSKKDPSGNDRAAIDTEEEKAGSESNMAFTYEQDYELDGKLILLVS